MIFLFDLASSVSIQLLTICLLYKSIAKMAIPINHFLFLVFIVITTYPLLNYFSFIVIVLYLFLLKFFQKNKLDTNLAWFYSIYSVFSSSLLAYFFTVLLHFIFGKTLYDNYEILLNLTFIPALSLFTNFILVKKVELELTFLRKNIDILNQNFLFTINVLLTICCTIQFTSYWIETHLLKKDNPIRAYMLVSFILLIVILLRYIRYKIREMERQRIQELKENQLHDLNAYVQQVEAMYDEIRSFKHDYHNVLISLNESIKTKDLTVIEHAYKQVLIKEGIALQEEQYSLTKLNNLKTLPIKGVFSTHIINAWQKKIKVHFEVEDVIQDEPIEILDYIRITSILLDNAIEAAEITRDPFLTIVFLMNHNRKEKRIIIENSYENEQLDTRKLFQKGYSTKGGDHGTGLATVEKILKEYPHISLQTEVEPFLFRQTLIIREEIKK
ncbi:hypothetical protein BCR26_11990 [Enterococcus rivorum]|uniref:Sensor histidine kinase NatK-like C-terminal domain-containing protein n=2 Tax=Enterococcus rivorum TaxID=762845 RepID=A0A1E5KY25_9ENTE|nr:hypothetical protein BCR26_11990 [Enterococcus rivorum]